MEGKEEADDIPFTYRSGGIKKSNMKGAAPLDAHLAQDDGSSHAGRKEEEE